jgi:peptide/nickel transport system substrate-binding protein
VPELAEAWKQPDPVTYLFRLRRGVKFHDGTDLTAEVVKWNFERMMWRRTRAPTRSLPRSTRVGGRRREESGWIRESGR